VLVAVLSLVQHELEVLQAIVGLLLVDVMDHRPGRNGTVGLLPDPSMLVYAPPIRQGEPNVAVDGYGS
jgi:hypothetical protein